MDERLHCIDPLHDPSLNPVPRVCRNRPFSERVTVKYLYARETPRPKRDQRNDPAEDLGHGEQHASVDDAEVVPVAFGWDGRGGKTGPNLDDLYTHLVCNRDSRFQGTVHHAYELIGVGTHDRRS